MKYKTKPIRVEAEQWFPNEMIKSGADAYGVVYAADPHQDRDSYVLKTNAGAFPIASGDYIVVGGGGKIVVPQVIFESQFEKDILITSN